VGDEQSGEATFAHERRANGSTGVDDLIGRDAAACQGTGAPQASGPPAFEIGGVTLADASLTYRDVAANTTLRTDTLAVTSLFTSGRSGPG
jgi:hypothetical protein